MEEVGGYLQVGAQGSAAAPAAASDAWPLLQLSGVACKHQRWKRPTCTCSFGSNGSPAPSPFNLPSFPPPPAHQGERDYAQLKGGTGPLVYPAGFVYLFAWLKTLTGGSVAVAQVRGWPCGQMMGGGVLAAPHHLPSPAPHAALVSLGPTPEPSLPPVPPRSTSLRASTWPRRRR